MLPMLNMALIDDDDIPAFERLYNECKDKSYFVAYDILKNESLAEECVSETFLSIAKSFQIVNNLEPHKQLRYVVISIKNTALNILKKEKADVSVRQYNFDDLSSDGNDSYCDPICLKRCLKKLNQTDLDILYLRCILQLEYKDICKTLGISYDAARTRVHTAKINLKRIIDKEDL